MALMLFLPVLLSVVLVSDCTSKPSDCSDIYNSGQNLSGIYSIYPAGDNPVLVYCDMISDGKGEDGEDGDGEDEDGEDEDGEDEDGEGEDEDGEDGDGEGEDGEGEDGDGEGEDGEGEDGDGEDGDGEGEDEEGEDGDGEGEGGDGEGEGGDGEGEDGEGEDGDGEEGEGGDGEGEDGEGEDGDGEGGDGEGEGEDGEDEDGDGEGGDGEGEGEDGEDEDGEDGDGWTVIQRRMDGSVNFYRGWEEYKRGFGNVEGEYWLGLENMYQLTRNRKYMLRVDLEDFKGRKVFAQYSSFSVGPGSDGYTLQVSGFTNGGAGDSLSSRHNGQKFSTFDNDQDTWEKNCAKEFLGAFWYKSCHYANPNGLYLWGEDNTHRGIGNIWVTWNNNWNVGMKSISMKIRRVS